MVVSHRLAYKYSLSAHHGESDYCSLNHHILLYSKINIVDQKYPSPICVLITNICRLPMRDDQFFYLNHQFPPLLTVGHFPAAFGKSPAVGEPSQPHFETPYRAWPLPTRGRGRGRGLLPAPARLVSAGGAQPYRSALSSGCMHLFYDHLGH